MGRCSAASIGRFYTAFWTGCSRLSSGATTSDLAYVFFPQYFLSFFLDLSVAKSVSKSSFYVRIPTCNTAIAIAWKKNGGSSITREDAAWHLIGCALWTSLMLVICRGKYATEIVERPCVRNYRQNTRCVLWPVVLPLMLRAFQIRPETASHALFTYMFSSIGLNSLHIKVWLSLWVQYLQYCYSTNGHKNNFK